MDSYAIKINISIKPEHIRGLSQNSLDKWTYSINRRHREMKFVPQRIQVMCIKFIFDIRYCIGLNFCIEGTLVHYSDLRRNFKIKKIKLIYM